MVTNQNSNVLSKVILRACWQEEDEQGMRAARPWLRWFLTRVVGMRLVPPRESESEQVSKWRWLTKRQEEGLKIDPETAEVFWGYGSVDNPYGLYDLTYEEENTGRNYFARAPGSHVWVSFYDLPNVVRHRLQERLDAGDFDNDGLSWLFDEAHFPRHRSGAGERLSPRISQLGC